MNNKSLGAFIAQLRKEKGMTQKQFAEILNVSDKTVSHWECDETSPDISLLLLIADIFNITVDELLKGERNPVKFKEPTYNFHAHAQKSNSQRFGSFKVQSIIVAAISLLSLISAVGVKALLDYFVFAQTANAFACSIVVCGAFIAIVCALIFALMLKNKLTDSEDKKEFTFKCIRITSLNIYLSLICISLFLSFYGKDKYVYFLICLAVLTVAELIIGKKISVYSGKEKLYALRRKAIILAAVFIMCGGFFQFCASEVYHPHPKNIIFFSAEKFKTYMETPKEKPPKAYLVDEQESMTAVHTEQEEYKEPEASSIETIYDDSGNEILSFRYLNKEVYDFAYHSEQKTFHVITYQAKIKAQVILDLCDGALGGIMAVYYFGVLAVTAFAYKKKKSEM